MSGFKIIRSVPWAGEMLAPGTTIPADVPVEVIRVWERNGKVEAEKTPAKPKPPPASDA